MRSTPDTAVPCRRFLLALVGAAPAEGAFSLLPAMGFASRP